MKISVVMICYNREKTIYSALSSIAKQLNNDDEIIVSDDNSSDQTIDIVKQLQKEYPIIKIFEHYNLGIEENMKFAFSKCQNEIVVIADSDDISLPGRIEKIRSCFESNSKLEVIYHNAEIIDENNNVTSLNFFETFNQKSSLINMMIKTTFYGACMAFKTSFINMYAKNIVANSIPWDRYLGFIAKARKTLMFLPDDKLLQYRRWLDNASIKKKSSLIQKFKVRFSWLKLYIKYRFN